MRSKADSPQLYELTRTIPKRLIEKAPQGRHGDYVPHFVIEQTLLAIVGPFDFTVTEILRAPVPEFTSKEGKTYPALPNAIVGVVSRLTVTIDGRVTTIDEAGSCTAEAFEDNDGERLKKAVSDALKRCAMRLGVGLHLWCKRADQFFINQVLRGDEKVAEDEAPVVGVEGGDE